MWCSSIALPRSHIGSSHVLARRSLLLRSLYLRSRSRSPPFLDQVHMFLRQLAWPGGGGRTADAGFGSRCYGHRRRALRFGPWRTTVDGTGRLERHLSCLRRWRNALCHIVALDKINDVLPDHTCVLQGGCLHDAHELQQILVGLPILRGISSFSCEHHFKFPYASDAAFETSSSSFGTARNSNTRGVSGVEPCAAIAHKVHTLPPPPSCTDNHEARSSARAAAQTMDARYTHA